MMYILLCNGASAVPLFIPILPQLLLIFYSIRYFHIGIVQHNSVKIIFALISIFILLVVLTAALQVDVDLFFKFSKTLVNSIFSVVAATALIYRYRDDFPEIYTNAVVKFSLLGIVGLCFTLISDWNISANIGERNYYTNLLTVWIADGDANSSLTYFSPFKYRLQSFFDEPGTFGIILIPALYYSIHKKQAIKIALLCSSIFLTESLNAWVGAFILFIYFFFKSSSKTHKVLFLISAFVIGLVFADVFRSLYEIKMGIDDAYSNNSSYGTRSLEYQYILDNLFFHALPLSNIRHAFDQLSGVSSAYIQWIIYGGWIFIIVLFSGMIAIGALYLKLRRDYPSNNYFSFILAISLYTSGFQRTSILDNVLFMTLFYWSLFNIFQRRNEVLVEAC